MEVAEPWLTSNFLRADTVTHHSTGRGLDAIARSACDGVSIAHATNRLDPSIRLEILQISRFASREAAIEGRSYKDSRLPPLATQEGEPYRQTEEDSVTYAVWGDLALECLVVHGRWSTRGEEDFRAELFQEIATDFLELCE